jgi:hypothetical protein
MHSVNRACRCVSEATVKDPFKPRRPKKRKRACTAGYPPCEVVSWATRCMTCIQLTCRTRGRSPSGRSRRSRIRGLASVSEPRHTCGMALLTDVLRKGAIAHQYSRREHCQNTNLHSRLRPGERSHLGWFLRLVSMARARQITKQPSLTWGGSEGVGGTKHDSAGLDGVKTLPDHADNWAGEH